MRCLLLIVLLSAWPTLAQGQEAGASTDADTDTDTDTGTDTGTNTGTGTDTGTGTGTGTNTGTNTGTGTGTGTGTNTGTNTDTTPTPTTTPAPPPKLAVVVAGDPDETLRETAAFLETEVRLSGLRVPTDPALRAAMLGEPTIVDDGLEGLRALRRGLGFDPRKDLSSYRRIGIIAGADALLVVHREGAIVLEVFDVSAAQFYEGALAFDDSSAEQRLKFIKSRAAQAQLRWSEPAPTPPASAPVKMNDPKQVADESRAKRRMKKAWPYLVAGALLAGGVTYLIIDRRRTNEPGPPLLRFRPGEE